MKKWDFTTGGYLVKKRERVLQPWELQKLHQLASTDVRRLMMLALQTGLRVNKLIEVHEEWLL